MRADSEPEPARALRVRARRRLIGAALLLLTTALVVPWLLDPAPRPVSDNLAIDIPSEREPFTPRLTTPAAVEPPTAAATEEPAPPQRPVQGPVGDVRQAEVGREGKYVVQAAALSSESAARELSERLRKAGFTPFTEKIETREGVRYRVRVGPYASREEAQRAQAGLRALGISSTLVVAG
ncbi:MAG: SPOR domain-containing protein [Sutterellaceae bacterium]|nr:SPOR domain-containing protein [Burkholderiaceae bacterium]MCX7902782.1 SPOR domain-containing protein [Burkholderiaceae bacterium]MDW8430720.1 SPOR domain-containing protein [Sutterellaceae bacterium]